MAEDRGRAKGFLLGLLAGGIAGGLTALLYAPKSGRELRKDIARRKDKMIDDAGKYIDNAKNKASVVLESGKKKAEGFISQAKKKAESLTKSAEKVYIEGKDRVVDEAVKYKGAVKAGIDTYTEERKSHRN